MSSNKQQTWKAYKEATAQVRKTYLEAKAQAQKEAEGRR